MMLHRLDAPRALLVWAASGYAVDVIDICAALVPTRPHADAIRRAFVDLHRDGRLPRRGSVRVLWDRHWQLARSWSGYGRRFHQAMMLLTGALRWNSSRPQQIATCHAVKDAADSFWDTPAHDQLIVARMRWFCRAVIRDAGATFDCPERDVIDAASAAFAAGEGLAGLSILKASDDYMRQVLEGV